MKNLETLEEAVELARDMEIWRCNFVPESDKYTFCYHHEGSFSVWRNDMLKVRVDHSAKLDIIDNKVTIMLLGDYHRDEVEEMQQILADFMEEESVNE